MTDALWQDPAPRTIEGQRLWNDLRLDHRIVPADPYLQMTRVRDIGQRICQIEHEATVLDLKVLAEAILWAWPRDTEWLPLNMQMIANYYVHRIEGGS